MTRRGWDESYASLRRGGPVCYRMCQSCAPDKVPYLNLTKSKHKQGKSPCRFCRSGAATASIKALTLLALR